jgi:protoporphyrin/coproporphyrin ferrochelatase
MRAVVLVNVGTPDAPDATSVRRYLKEFLSDPFVLDMPAAARWALLNLVILPTRPKHSAAAYQKVWTAEGSPLLAISRRQQAGLQQRLPGAKVLLAMRYGSPSLAEAARAMAEARCDEVVLVPLYPQYARASTLSAFDAAKQAISETPMTSVGPFYADDGFLKAWEAVLRETLERAGSVDHVVFSYHGLPERQVKACDATGAHCFVKAGCCDAIVAANRDCYRAQCFATSRALIERLKLPSASSCFQSRLGRTPWIQPFTDQHVPALLGQGKKRVVVACPSFVTDCLETLEEVGVRLRESFLAAGGESFTLAPCLNDHPVWLDALAGLVSR